MSIPVADQGSPKTPQTISAIAIGCLPEHENKSLLLKTLRTWSRGLKGIRVDPIWKRPL